MDMIPILTRGQGAALRRSRARRAPLAITAGLLASFVLGPATTLAHAELATVVPADKSTVAGPPSQVVMTFTEDLNPSASSIVLVDSGGAVVAQGSTVDSGNLKTMRLVFFNDLAPGAYTVRWTSKSAQDGDVARGTTTFTVGAAPSTAPSASSSPSPGPSIEGSVGPSAESSIAASPAPSTPASSTSDAVIPVIVALIVLAALGLWLLRGRARAGR